MEHGSWSKFNPALKDNDATEYDLYFCINRNDKDGMFLKYDHRFYRYNSFFFLLFGQWIAICEMDDGDVQQPIIKLRGNRAYICKWAKFVSKDKSSYKDLVRLGIDEETDLLEVGGCLLRLAMWPTKRLFDAADKIMQNSRGKNSILRIGVHYRCGDIAFTKSSQVADKACTHDIHNPSFTNEAEHMKFGTPIDVGACAKYMVLKNENEKLKRELNLLQDAGDMSNVTGSMNAKESKSEIAVYVSSDNQGSALQINETVGNLAQTTVFPHGCHIQITNTFDCLLETSAYWLVLAMSDYLITQTEQYAKVPISAYSRYAAMYGLKGREVLRDGKDCTNVLDRYQQSRTQQGNWFCEGRK